MLSPTPSAESPRVYHLRGNHQVRGRGIFLPAEVSDAAIAFRPSYFLQDLGHPHTSFQPPAVQADRLAWGKWLKGMALVYGCGGAFVVLLASGSTMRPLEATAQMERLAARVDHTR